MATLRTEFGRALTNIEVNGEKAQRASEAQAEIRQLLEADQALRAWGVDTRLIGSYSRDTGIYPGKDVDVFVKLTQLDTGSSPTDVFDAVWSVLEHEYGDAEHGGRATPQARSIKISFPDSEKPWDENSGFAVDAVPAVKDGTRWAIPTRDRATWVATSGRWVTTDPEKFGELSSALSTSSASPTVGERDAYKPVVKLMRQARRTHLGDRRPGGLYVEFATYDVWSSGLVSGEEWDTLFAASLRRVADRFSAGIHTPLLDPALNTPVEPPSTIADLTNAASTFARLANLAEEALVADECKAAVKWREILGGNDRADPAFPLPSGCDANGFPIASIAVVASRGRVEAPGFG